MKTSRRHFIKTAAVGVGATTVTSLNPKEAGATQVNEVRKWDYEASIVVLGTGAAGFMTAITAHDQGADVLILEKASEAHSGGNSRVSGQGYWCPSDLSNTITYQKEMNDGYPVPDDVVQSFHEHSVNLTEWLTKMGADMRTIPTKGEYPEFPGGAGNVCWAKVG